MGARWDLNAITAAFTNAAVDPTRWGAAMDTLCEVTGSPGAALFAIRGQLPAGPHSQSLLPSLDAYRRDGWIYRDERYRAVGAFRKKSVVTEFDFTTAEEIARHPYYQEFLAPFGLRWFAGVKIACEDDLWCLSVQRSIAQGPFSRPELKMFAALSARLSSVAALARMLGHAKAETALEVFEASGKAAILMDPYGKFFRANAAAEKMLGTDLQIREGQLVSTDRDTTAALQRALHCLSWGREEASVAPVVLPRRGAGPVVAYPIRLTSLAQDVLAPVRTAVILVDLDRRPTAAGGVLCSLFGLTPAEAKLANILSGGESLEAAAGALGIAYETARNQLKSVFAKTETNRQGELIALASRLAPPISCP